MTLHGRIERAYAAERLLTKLWWLMLALGLIAIIVVAAQSILGETWWQRAATGILGILASTVLSGATAYGAGTNVGLSAVKLKFRLQDQDDASTFLTSPGIGAIPSLFPTSRA